MCWLSWPWQAIYRLSTRLGQLLPWASAAMVFLPVVFVVAFVTVARQDALPERVVPVLALLVVLALAIFVHPVADAAVSRAGEHAADRVRPPSRRRSRPGRRAAAARRPQPGQCLGSVASRPPAAAGSAAAAGQVIGVRTRRSAVALVRRLCQVVIVGISRWAGPRTASIPPRVCTPNTVPRVTAARPVSSHGGRAGRSSTGLAWVRRARVRTVDAG